VAGSGGGQALKKGGRELLGVIYYKKYAWITVRYRSIAIML